MGVTCLEPEVMGSGLVLGQPGGLDPRETAWTLGPMVPAWNRGRLGTSFHGSLSGT